MKFDQAMNDHRIMIFRDGLRLIYHYGESGFFIHPEKKVSERLIKDQMVHLLKLLCQSSRIGQLHIFKNTEGRYY